MSWARFFWVPLVLFWCTDANSEVIFTLNETWTATPLNIPDTVPSYTLTVTFPDEDSIASLSLDGNDNHTATLTSGTFATTFDLGIFNLATNADGTLNKTEIVLFFGAVPSRSMGKEGAFTFEGNLNNVRVPIPGGEPEVHTGWSVSAASVPEPSSFMCLGLLGIAVAGINKFRRLV